MSSHTASRDVLDDAVVSRRIGYKTCTEASSLHPLIPSLTHEYCNTFLHCATRGVNHVGDNGTRRNLWPGHTAEARLP